MLLEGMSLTEVQRYYKISYNDVCAILSSIKPPRYLSGVCGFEKKTAYYEKESELIKVVNGKIKYDPNDLKGDELEMYNQITK
jgi:hypothetical protein